MVNKQLKARLKPHDLKQFELLALKINTKDTYTETKDTINKAVELALKHLALKEKLKEMFGGVI